MGIFSFKILIFVRIAQLFVLIHSNTLGETSIPCSNIRGQKLLSFPNNYKEKQHYQFYHSNSILLLWDYLLLYTRERFFLNHYQTWYIYIIHKYFCMWSAEKSFVNLVKFNAKHKSVNVTCKFKFSINVRKIQINSKVNISQVLNIIW